MLYDFYTRFENYDSLEPKAIRIIFCGIQTNAEMGR